LYNLIITNTNLHQFQINETPLAIQVPKK